MSMIFIEKSNLELFGITKNFPYIGEVYRGHSRALVVQSVKSLLCGLSFTSSLKQPEFWLPTSAKTSDTVCD